MSERLDALVEIVHVFSMPIHMVPAALYEAIFNSSPTGNYLLSPTPEAIILAVNDAFLQASGRRREDMVGASLFTIFPRDADDPNDVGEAALRSSLAQVLATAQPDVLPAVRYPIRVELAQGGIGYEERFWSAVSTPILSKNGEILCISHSTTDVTDLVRSERSKRESERRFAALINATTDVIYRMSPNWTHMHELDGRGFLKTTSGWAEYRIEDYVYPEDIDLARNAITEAIRTKTIFELEHRVLRADGSHGWTYSRAVPILESTGDICEWVGSASDITERKVAEEELKAASHRKDEFLAMLAHELRNPLAPIKAAAQLLQLRALDEERLRYTSKIIERQVAHMTNLVDELLDVSRVSRNLVKLDRVPLDISHVVADAVEQVTPLIRSRHLRLEMDLCPEAAFLEGDKKRLVQILANLLSNAAKFTNEGGKIHLRTDVLETRIRIELIDSGIGMTPATARHVFELFSQAERSSDRSLGGLGLGLALVKSLVELHGGTVDCCSPGLGLGSKFTVHLPRLLSHEPDEEPEVSPTLLREQSRALRIMVVDDNVDAAAMLKMLLEAMGHEVVVEHRSTAALERAAQYLPHVCLLDIGLPEMDGNELAQRLRGQSETATAVLVAVTGYGNESDRKRSTISGFSYHLVKPVDMEKLGSILSEI